MLLSDKLYDKTSLVFENGSLLRISDPKDSNDLPEGRLGEFPIDRFKTSFGLTFFVPLTRRSRTLKDAVPSVNNREAYRVSSENRYLSVEKRESADGPKAVDALNANGNLVKCAVDLPNTLQWLGFVDTQKNGIMLGLVRSIKAADGSYYFVTYAGIGNFTDIRMEFNELAAPIQRRLS